MTQNLTGKWNYPTTVWAGPDRIRELPDACRALGMRRPLLVTDRGLWDAPMIANAVKSNADAGIPTALFGEVKGNPTLANVASGLGLYRSHQADGVVAM